MNLGQAISSELTAETQRLTCLIWGPVGSGKTPLAITAPDPIVYFLFDVDGHKSVMHVKHRYHLFDFTAFEVDVVEWFTTTMSPFMRDLDKELAKGVVKTVVVDSVSAFLERALVRGVQIVAPSVRGVKPSIISPQLQGYGARSTLTKAMAMTLHQVCARHNVNLILICHEKVNTDEDGVATSIVPLLPGESGVQIPRSISEIWHLREYEGQRRVYIRPWNKYEGCRTRMFLSVHGGPSFFPWRFDADKWEGPGRIEAWIEQWRSNNGHKIEVPK